MIATPLRCSLGYPASSLDADHQGVCEHSLAAFGSPQEVSSHQNKAPRVSPVRNENSSKLFFKQPKLNNRNSTDVVSGKFVTYCCAIFWLWRGAAKEHPLYGAATEKQRSPNQRGAQP